MDQHEDFMDRHARMVNNVRVRSVLVMFVAAILIPALVMDGQTPRTRRPSLSILDDEAARIKHQTDAPSIRPLVNSLFAASLLSTTPGAIKERLVTAETSFRTTHPKTIIIGSIVNAANAFASATQLPRYSETIPEQVVALRMTLLKYFPTLLQPPIVAAAPDYQSFSPVGAFFLTDLLLRQKLTNPKFQVSPEEWRRQSIAPQPQVSPRGPSLSITAQPPEVPAYTKRLHDELSTEGSSSALAVRTLFDNLGF